jgi:citrate synthase
VIEMSECKLNHSQEDVRNKYQSQEAFLPEDMKPLFKQFFSNEHTQDLLNEVFHLLKKYDLASDEDRNERNNRLYLVLNNV